MLKCLKRVIFSVITILGVMIAIEGVFYFTGYRGNQFRSILFGDDPNSPLLFEESPFLWWKLRKNVDIKFLGQQVTTDEFGFRISHHESKSKVSNIFRVLCLGDSSTFGWRLNYSQTYPFLLEQRLKRMIGEVEVINGGIPGYTTFQTRLLLENIMDRVELDAIIIYSSNNETSFSKYSDAERFETARKTLSLRSWMNRSLSYQFMKGMLKKTEPFNIRGNITLAQLSKSSSRVSIAQYRKNMIEIIKLSKQKGLALLFVTVPSNIGSSFFLKIPDKNTQVNILLEMAEKHILEKRYQEALTDLERAQALSPDYYRIFFQKGRIFQTTKKRGSIKEYERALELHPFPNRLKQSYNMILMRTASEYKVPFVDLYTATRDHPLGLDRLFIDACHPSPLGHKYIASLLEVPILDLIRKRR